MKVLLHADVPKLGYFGDVVEVKEGYARNYLLPQRLGVEPTESNIKAIEDERARQAEVRRLAREQLVKAAAKVEGAEVRIAALANELGHLFGSVGEEEIAAQLREQGFEVQSRQVSLKEPLRSLGRYEVELQFDKDIKAAVAVSVVRPEDEEGASKAKTRTESGSEDAGDAARD